MSDGNLLRVLELAARQLGALDAHLEIGGAPPVGGDCLWADVGPHRRVVVRFAEPPADADALQARLEGLVDAFSDLARQPTPSAPQPADTELEQQLVDLAEHAGARCTLVIDDSSPAVWGSSHRELVGPQALDELLHQVDGQAGRTDEPSPTNRTAGGSAAADTTGPNAAPTAIDELRRHAARACSALRAGLGDRGAHRRDRWLHTAAPHRWYARRLGDIYWLVLILQPPLSEMRIEAAVRARLARIARLVERLPPFDPPGGRLFRLRRLE